MYMYKYTEIDFASWPRTRLFEHFKNFTSPGINVTCKLDAKILCGFAKSNNESLFLLSLYSILRVANFIPEMRQRELDGKVVEFERIGAITPIMPCGEKNFVEIICGYEDDFPTFKAQCAPLIEAVKSGKNHSIPAVREDTICATCNPWFHFDAATFATFSPHQSMPLIAWGKVKDGLMPLTLRANHCFIDGIHIGEFYNKLQRFFENPAELYEKTESDTAKIQNH